MNSLFHRSSMPLEVHVYYYRSYLDGEYRAVIHSAQQLFKLPLQVLSPAGMVYVWLQQTKKKEPSPYKATLLHIYLNGPFFFTFNFKVWPYFISLLSARSSSEDRMQRTCNPRTEGEAICLWAGVEAYPMGRETTSSTWGSGLESRMIL